MTKKKAIILTCSIVVLTAIIFVTVKTQGRGIVRSMFLPAGTEAVVATDGDVTDETAQILSERIQKQQENTARIQAEQQRMIQQSQRMSQRSHEDVQRTLRSIQEINRINEMNRQFQQIQRHSTP